MERALSGGAVKRAQDVGGATAGADADDRIPRTDPCAARRVATEIAIVLGGGFVDGVGLDEVGGNAEGGRAFGCVEAGDQAACACAEVMQPPARPQALRDRLDGASHLVDLRPNRAHRRDVLRVHDGDELKRSELVELIGARVRALAQGAVIPVMTSAAASAHTRADPLVAM